MRKSHGLNQSQFAKKVGLTQSAISQYEDGKRSPSFEALQKISAGFDAPLDVLLNRKEDNEEQDNEREAALHALMRNIKYRNISKDAIIALNCFIVECFPS